MSTDAFPWMKLYPRETLSDGNFSSWSLEERGAWLTLVLHNWIEGSLPADQTSLARVLHVDPQTMRGLWSALGSRFIPHPGMPGRLTSPRLEIEREKAKEMAEKRSAAGSKAITARWDKAKARHTKRIRNEYATDTNEVRSDTNTGTGTGTDSGSGSGADPASQKTGRLADLDAGLVSVAKKLGAAYGRQGPLGAGRDWNRVCSSFGRWLEAVGEDALVAECLRIAKEQNVEPSHLSWWPGWLDTVADADLARSAQ